MTLESPSSPAAARIAATRAGSRDFHDRSCSLRTSYLASIERSVEVCVARCCDVLFVGGRAAIARADVRASPRRLRRHRLPHRFSVLSPTIRPKMSSSARRKRMCIVSAWRIGWARRHSEIAGDAQLRHASAAYSGAWPRLSTPRSPGSPRVRPASRPHRAERAPAIAIASFMLRARRPSGAHPVDDVLSG